MYHVSIATVAQWPIRVCVVAHLLPVIFIKITITSRPGKKWDLGFLDPEEHLLRA